jgi:hypothetical protein
MDMIINSLFLKKSEEKLLMMHTNQKRILQPIIKPPSKASQDLSEALLLQKP